MRIPGAGALFLFFVSGVLYTIERTVYVHEGHSQHAAKRTRKRDQPNAERKPKGDSVCLCFFDRLHGKSVKDFAKLVHISTIFCDRIMIPEWGNGHSWCCSLSLLEGGGCVLGMVSAFFFCKKNSTWRCYSSRIFSIGTPSACARARTVLTLAILISFFFCS